MDATPPAPVFVPIQPPSSAEGLPATPQFAQAPPVPIYTPPPLPPAPVVPPPAVEPAFSRAVGAIAPSYDAPPAWTPAPPPPPPPAPVSVVRPQPLAPGQAEGLRIASARSPQRDDARHLLDARAGRRHLDADQRLPMEDGRGAGGHRRRRHHRRPRLSAREGRAARRARSPRRPRAPRRRRPPRRQPVDRRARRRDGLKSRRSPPARGFCSTGSLPAIHRCRSTASPPDATPSRSFRRLARSSGPFVSRPAAPPSSTSRSSRAGSGSSRPSSSKSPKAAR